MLNNTSSFYRPKQIDFTVMGLDKATSDYLNLCMQERDNFEFLLELGAFTKPSRAMTFHLDHLIKIQILEEVVKHQRP